MGPRIKSGDDAVSMGRAVLVPSGGRAEPVRAKRLGAFAELNPADQGFHIRISEFLMGEALPVTTHPGVVPGLDPGTH